MNGTLPAPSGQQGDSRHALRALGLAAVCVGLAGLAGATFVLSYPGIHAVALEAGVSPRLARGYPLLLDAMLIVVLAAVLSLRGAGMPSKVLAWLTLLGLLAATAGADALHAAKTKLPATAAEITAAVLPWVLLLLAFILLLAMLRNARLRRLDGGLQASHQRAAGQILTGQRAAAPDILPGFHTLPGQAASAAPAADAAASDAAASDAPDSAAVPDVPPDSQSAVFDLTARDTDAPSGADLVSETQPANENEPADANQPADANRPASGADPLSRTETPAGDPSIDGTAVAQAEVVESDAGTDAPFGSVSLAPAGAPEATGPDMPVFQRITSPPVRPSGT
ncbi:MAG: DUF2637 domain-containing protein [Streptosporangiaceae bacterium]